MSTDTIYGSQGGLIRKLAGFFLQAFPTRNGFSLIQIIDRT
jgi:hypothetical protein